jgi:hypothetical protein
MRFIGGLTVATIRAPGFANMPQDLSQMAQMLSLLQLAANKENPLNKSLNPIQGTEGAGAMGTGGGARAMPRFVQEQHEWAAKNGIQLSPEQIAKNVQSRIRQIEYDRRLTGKPEGEKYPPDGELHSLRSWLRGK